MARLFVTDINLNKNELLNARIQGLTNAPSNPVTGQIYYNTLDNTMYYYNGLSSPNGPWMPMSGSTEVIQDVIGSSIIGGTGIDLTYNDQAGTLSIDIDPTVVTTESTQTLYNKTLGGNAGGVSLGSNLNADNHYITNVPDPINPQDAANRRYVDNAVSGLNWKSSVNLIARSNFNIGDPSIDGHPVGVSQIGYRVLLTAQSSSANNGIYEIVSDGVDGVTVQRPADADSYTELIGAAIFVLEGTQYGSTSWVQSNHYLTSFVGQEWVQFSGTGTYSEGNGITLDGLEISAEIDTTQGLKFNGTAIAANIDTASGLEFDTSGANAGKLKVNLGTGLIFDANGQITNDSNNGYGLRKKIESLGNGSASSFTITHNFGTKYVTVQIFQSASPYSQVEADVEHTDTNSLTIRFATAPGTGEYEAVVIG